MFLLKFAGIIIIIIIYARDTLEVSDWVGEWATTRLSWQSLLVRCFSVFGSHLQKTRRRSSWGPRDVTTTPASTALGPTNPVGRFSSAYSGGRWYKGELIAHEVGKAQHRECLRQILSLSRGLSIRNSFLLYQQHILLMADYACRVWDALWGCCS